MLIEGSIIKDGRWHLVEVPLLDAMTQGHNRAEALSMVADLVETLVDRPGFKVQVQDHGHERLTLLVSDPAAVIALGLRRRREAAGLSLQDVADRLGAKSKNAYARYEQGTSIPTVTKLAELLQAVDPERDLAVSVG